LVPFLLDYIFYETYYKTENLPNTLLNRIRNRVDNVHKVEVSSGTYHAVGTGATRRAAKHAAAQGMMEQIGRDVDAAKRASGYSSSDSD
jgi:dsRNA-specific ribonuclease